MKGYPEEAFVISKLMSHGFNCCLPYAPAQYDIIAVKNDIILKIQVKLISKYKDSGSHFINLRASNKKYQKGDFDYFVGVHMKKDECYILPFEFIEGMSKIRVSYGQTNDPVENYRNNWLTLERV